MIALVFWRWGAKDKNLGYPVWPANICQKGQEQFTIQGSFQHSFSLRQVSNGQTGLTSAASSPRLCGFASGYAEFSRDRQYALEQAYGTGLVPVPKPGENMPGVHDLCSILCVFLKYLGGLQFSGHGLRTPVLLMPEQDSNLQFIAKTSTPQL